MQVSNGLAVMVIQHYIPCLKCCAACKWYFRDVLFFAVGGSALLGMFFMVPLVPFNVGKRWRDRRSESVVTDKFRRSVSLLRSLSGDNDRSQETSPLLGGDRGQSYS